MATDSLPAEEQILSTSLSERTQAQWDALHDIAMGHNVYCECQVCKDVFKYLTHVQSGGRIGHGL